MTRVRVLTLFSLGTLGFPIPAAGLEPVTTLSASDVAAPQTNYFGWSVALNGNIIAVGAPRDDTLESGSGHGAVYVFRWTGSRWGQEAKVYGSQAGFNDEFGTSLALRGDVLVVGQPHSDLLGSDFGLAYVFRRTPSGTWVEQQVLTPSLPALEDYFGAAVAIDGERIAVGALGGPSVGHVFVFGWNGTQWLEEGAFTGSDTIGGDLFGRTLVLQGATIAVGVPDRDDFGDRSGAVYLFEYDGAAWAQSQRLTAGNASSGDAFGSSIALHFDMLLVGAPGANVGSVSSGGVYLFRDGPTGWTEEGVLMQTDAQSAAQFGQEIAVSDPHLLIGAPNDDPVGFTSSGSAYLFEPNGNSWTQKIKFTRPPAALHYGSDVAVDQRWAVIADSGRGNVDVFCVSPLSPCIPALSNWGVMILGTLLAVAASVRLRRVPRFVLAVPIILIGTVGLAQDPRLEHPHHPEHLLVRFKPESEQASRNASHAAAGGLALKTFRYVPGLTLVHVQQQQLGLALAAYAADPNVLYAEPDSYAEVSAIPNDTWFPRLWGMLNTGNNLPGNPGTPGADIRAVPAWDFWQGDADFRIAILDTGIHPHSDLDANIWRNPVEYPYEGDANGDGCPGVCGVDDDGDGLIDEVPEFMFEGHQPSWDDDENGFTDDWYGWSFHGTIEDPFPVDDTGHGTHVAGIAGATGNNARGVTGVNWRCKLVSLKLNDPGTGFIQVSTMVDGLDYVIANKIKVSNNSYRYYGFHEAHYDAILAARD